MINLNPPDTWQELEEAVSQILTECGFAVERRKVIQTVRGSVEIDVFAIEESQSPPVTYLIECKHWQSAIPQTIIHAFRTIVSDYGANWGILISSVGFQKGVYEAARNSNIRLLSWDEFQELFKRRWFQNFFVPTLEREANRLVSYTEPINSVVFRRADALDEEGQQRFRQLREEYANTAFLALSMYRFWGIVGEDRFPTLPLRNNLNQRVNIGHHLPDDVINAVALRDFLEKLVRRVRRGLQEFDNLFN